MNSQSGSLTRNLELKEGLPDKWELSFTVQEMPSGTAEPVSGERTLLNLSSRQGEIILVTGQGSFLRAAVYTRWDQTTERFGEKPSFEFTLEAPLQEGRYTLQWREYSVRLMFEKELIDEDWPLGKTFSGPSTVSYADSLSEVSLQPLYETQEDSSHGSDTFTGPFQFFCPPGWNTGAGDCMPFSRDGRYALYYLLDRRSHQSKKGLGAHQWAQVSSADLATWTLHPMAVPITEQWEGSICTGSLIENQGNIYTFYAVRMSDGSAARLTYAVSRDGVHFTKSGCYVTLTAPYEPSSARDPKVFQDQHGGFHMLVTTSVWQGNAWKGCLAHLVSQDLQTWEQKEPFLIPGYNGQPECSDYFFWNGWYYLVFSNDAVAHYRMSRRPLGPWIRPLFDELDARNVQVPKTALYQGRLFSSGFLTRRPPSYAGNVITHELFQRPDGTLGAKPLEEILPGTIREDVPQSVHLMAGEGRDEYPFPSCRKGFRLRMHIGAEEKNVLTGIAFKVLGQRYELRLDPAAGTANFVRPQEFFDYGTVRDLVPGLDFSHGIDLDLFLYEDILDVFFTGGRVMTFRLEKSAAQPSDGVMPIVYAIAGDALISDIRYEKVR